MIFPSNLARCGALLLAIVSFSAGLGVERSLAASPSSGAPAPRQATRCRRALFEANLGQGEAGARFVVRQGGAEILFRRGGWSVSPVEGGGRVDFELVENPLAEPVPVDPLDAWTNTFRGRDTTGWVVAAPLFGALRYEVRPGLSVLFRDAEGEVEYDVEMAPGLGSGGLRLRVSGPGARELGPEGDLRVRTGSGVVGQTVPRAFRFDPDGERHPVKVSSRLGEEGLLQFVVDGEDGGRRTVIDPILSYSSYYLDKSVSFYAIRTDPLGNVFTLHWDSGIVVTKWDPTAKVLLWKTVLPRGSGSDSGVTLAVDGAGNSYVGGYTTSSDFPVTPYAADPYCGYTGACGGVKDGFVVKLDAAGALSYGTFIGGYAEDRVLAIDVDAQGQVAATGMTKSLSYQQWGYGPEADFPTTAGAFQNSYYGNMNVSYAFATKLAADGSSFVASTLLGGSTESQEGLSIAAVGAEMFVGGHTWANNFPIVSSTALFPVNYSFDESGFASRISADATRLVHSTYLPPGARTVTGNTVFARTYGVAADRAGNTYAAGFSTGIEFPTTPGAFQEQASFRGKAFVVKFAPDGKVVYSTCLRGGSPGAGAAGNVSGWQHALAVVADDNGSAIVAGKLEANQLDFPLLYPIQSEAGGVRLGGFVTKFAPDGKELEFSTFFHGNGGTNVYSGDVVEALALAPGGGLWIAGSTEGGIPLTPDALHGTNGSDFLARIDGVTGSGGPLTSGKPVSGTVGDPGPVGRWVNFAVDVPPNTFRLEIRLGGLSADADLYVDYGNPPTSSEQACSSTNAGTEPEVCSVSRPVAGTWWVGVYNHDSGPITFRLTAILVPPPAPSRLRVISPCRVVDTREATFPEGLGKPTLSPGVDRTFPVLVSPCLIPSRARAIAANVTVANVTAAGHLTFFPGDGVAPLASTINFRSGQVRANNAILMLPSDGTGTIIVRSGSPGTLDVIIDVMGYFE